MKDRIVGFIEYAIATVCLLGAASLAVTPAIESSSPLLSILGTRVAILIYAGLFLVFGVGLLYTKLRGHVEWKRRILLTLYAACVFVFLLELGYVGWTLALVDEILLGLLAAVAYLSRFKKPPMTLEDFLDEE